jgi:hypothetical protein
METKKKVIKVRRNLFDMPKKQADELAAKYIRYPIKAITGNKEKMKESIDAVRYYGGAKKVPLEYVPAERIQGRVDLFKELLKKKTLPSNKEKPSSLTKYIKENQSTFEKLQKEEEKKITEKIPKMILDGYTKGQLAKVAKAAKDKAKARMEKDYLKL